MKKILKLIIKILIAFLVCFLVVFVVYHNKETKTPANEINSNNIKKINITYYRGNDSSLKKVIDKNTSNKYNINVYTYGGDVDVTLEGEDAVYKFKDALEMEVITIDDIINQAKEDAIKGKCQLNQYLDGGSIEYIYPKYTILKYDTDDVYGNSNKDLVIGMTGEIIRQVNRIIYDE